MKTKNENAGMRPLVYISKNINELTPYQKMIECFASAALVKGKYLDLMNFNKNEFKQVINPKSVENIFEPEHGYTSPDGSMELSLLIKELETERLVENNKLSRADAEKIISQTASGLGNGVTGVLSGILWAIKKLLPLKNEIITFRPSYPLAESLAEQNGFFVRSVNTKIENLFRPTFEEIQLNCTYRTAAVVLVYPNNPTFVTFRKKEELEKIINFCQKNQIFLIADNIYQELMYDPAKHIEIFSLTDKPDYLIKIFGPSKDRPFFTGHRLGYYIGDPRVAENYFDYCSTNFVCLGTFSKNIFSLDLLFRILLLKGAEKVGMNDLSLLLPFLAGWMQTIDQDEIYKRINSENIFEKYRTAVLYNNQKLLKNLNLVKEFVLYSSAFGGIVNGNGGNAIFIKANTYKKDLDLYWELLTQKGIAIYPGNIFGMKEDPREVWFRITIIHDSIENILQLLREMELFILSED